MKILITIITLFLASVLLPNIGTSQFITKNKKKYIYQENEYDKNSISSIFHQSSQSTLYYQTARIARDYGKKQILVGTSLICIAIIISTSNVEDSGSFISSTGFNVMAISGVLIDLLSVFYFRRAKKNMKSAVNHFNWEIQQELKKQSSVMDIGITANGLGMVYTF